MRHGGRQKGTPNKRSLDAIANADKIGVDPLTFLLMVVRGDLRDFGYVFSDDEITQEVVNELDEEERKDVLILDKKVMACHPKYLVPLDMRMAAAKEAAPYLYGKLKSVEISFEDEVVEKVMKFIAKDEFNTSKGDS